MKTTQSQFDTARQSFSTRVLTPSQKERMLNTITSEDSERISPTASPYFRSFRYGHQSIRAFAAFLFIFFLLGTTYVSAHSLPGDTLYAVKVNALEPLVQSLIFSTPAKQRYTITLLERRTQELATLEKNGHLTEESRMRNTDAASRIILFLETESLPPDTASTALTKITEYKTRLSTDIRSMADTMPALDTISPEKVIRGGKTSTGKGTTTILIPVSGDSSTLSTTSGDILELDSDASLPMPGEKDPEEKTADIPRDPIPVDPKTIDL